MSHKKETRLVTMKSEQEVGINPIKNNEIDSKTRSSFLQFPLNLCLTSIDLTNSLNVALSIQVTIGIK